MEKDLDKKLYNDYLNGEKEAFEILYNKYKNKIKYFIYNNSKRLSKSRRHNSRNFYIRYTTPNERK